MLEALTQKNLFLIFIIGDFNAKFYKWCSTDETTPEETKLDNLTSQYGLTQLLKEPAIIFDNHRSCIDLTFTSQPNLVADFRIHLSLHENCHRQYERIIWHHSSIQIEGVETFCPLDHILA